MKQILLEGVLPEVFALGSIPSSQVWQSRLVLEQGGVYLIESGSGRGKTSLCSFLMGQRRDYMGNIYFDGREARTYSSAEWATLRREGIGYLPQDLELFEELTARDNLLIRSEILGLELSAEIDRLLDLLGLTERKDYPIHKLSIGQRQRVAFARMLLGEVSFYLLDEPVSHLDEENNKLMAQLLMEKVKKTGAGVITTSVGNPLLLGYDRVFRL